MTQVIYNGQPAEKKLSQDYARVINEMMTADPDVLNMDADLMCAVGTENFDKQFPGRSIDCGIAEANMIGVAAGLAYMGKKPFAHSFGCFATRRTFDQIFISAGYGRNDLRLVGSDPGVTATMNGGTHMPFEDTGLLRTVPGAKIFDICDNVQLEAVLHLMKDGHGVQYVRMPRSNYYPIYASGTPFEVGKGVTLREGSDVAIIASGIMVAKALDAAAVLSKEGIEARVVDMFCIKPIDRALIDACAKECGCLVVADNHNCNGGLGDAVAAAAVTMTPVPMDFVNVQDEFGEVGPEDFLCQRFGLTAENLVSKAKAVIARK